MYKKRLADEQAQKAVEGVDDTAVDKDNGDEAVRDSRNDANVVTDNEEPAYVETGVVPEPVNTSQDGDPLDEVVRSSDD